MKKQISIFNTKNSAKLFLGVFVSVVSLFALSFLVGNPLFQGESSAATVYSYSITVRPSVKTSGCNSKISYYVISSSFVSSSNTGYVVGRTTNTVRRASPVTFTTKTSKVFKGPVIVIQKATAYTAAGGYIGSQNLGASASIAPNGSVIRYLTIPCNIF